MELPTQSIALDVTMPWGDVRISADVPGLRQGDAGCLQMTLRPGAVATGQKEQQTPRADVLVNLWPQHVLLCAAGWDVRTVAVGLDGVTVLPTLPVLQAQLVLTQWLAAYLQAWSRPLPITFKAGLAFAAEQARQSQSDKDLDPHHVIDLALDKASKAFQDSFAEDTDFARSLYVQRSFDNFEPLRLGLPDWAPVLYADLIRTAVMEGVAT